MCATHQKSLVYIEFNSLNVNSTALKELGLLRSQVSADVSKKKIANANKNFLSAID